MRAANCSSTRDPAFQTSLATKSAERAIRIHERVVVTLQASSESQNEQNDQDDSSDPDSTVGTVCVIPATTAE